MSKKHIITNINAFIANHGDDPGYKTLERASGITANDVKAHFDSLTEATKIAKSLQAKSKKAKDYAIRKYHVYAVELSPNVWAEKKVFRDQNPDFDPAHLRAGSLYLYVGATQKETPEERVQQHVAGIKAGKKIVTDFIKNKNHLVVDRFTKRSLPYKSQDDCDATESEWAEHLRRQGHVVYSN